MRRYSLKNADATHPIKPLLSPVKNPTINGLSLFSDQAGVGLTPTLAWAAPDLGKPTGCIVYIYQLGISGGSTTSNRVGRLFLDGKLTSVTLPAGILASGNEYYFVIRVVFDPSWNPLAEPLYANMAPFQRSETASNLVTP
jgi:hypothetical protein